MIRGIHHVAVHVRDIDKMVKFYCEAFGFTAIGYVYAWADNPTIDEVIDVRGSAAKNVMLRAGNVYLELFQYSAPPPSSSKALKPYDHGYTHFCVDVTGIDAEVERLRKLGMTFDRPHGKGTAVDVVIVKAIYGRDPEGNIIEIQETLTDCAFAGELLPKANLAAAEM